MMQLVERPLAQLDHAIGAIGFHHLHTNGLDGRIVSGVRHDQIELVLYRDTLNARDNPSEQNVCNVRHHDKHRIGTLLPEQLSQ